MEKPSLIAPILVIIVTLAFLTLAIGGRDRYELVSNPTVKSSEDATIKITGIVIDENSGEPLSNVLVLRNIKGFWRGHSQTLVCTDSHYAASDENGQFEFMWTPSPDDQKYLQQDSFYSNVYVYKAGHILSDTSILEDAKAYHDYWDAQAAERRFVRGLFVRYMKTSELPNSERLRYLSNQAKRSYCSDQEFGTDTYFPFYYPIALEMQSLAVSEYEKYHLAGPLQRRLASYYENNKSLTPPEEYFRLKLTSYPEKTAPLTTYLKQKDANNALKELDNIQSQYSNNPGLLSHYISEERDAADRTPLMIASSGCMTPVAEKLVSLGAHINSHNFTENYNTALGAAMSKTIHGDQACAETAKYLISRKEINLDARVVDGHTALSYAASNASAEMVKLLLEKGADPNIVMYPQSFDRATALGEVLNKMFSTRFDDPGKEALDTEKWMAPVRALINSKTIDLNMEAFRGLSPLMMTGWGSGEEAKTVVELLLAAGADPLHGSNRNGTPVEYLLKHANQGRRRPDYADTLAPIITLYRRGSDEVRKTIRGKLDVSRLDKNREKITEMLSTMNGDDVVDDLNLSSLVQ